MTLRFVRNAAARPQPERRASALSEVAAAEARREISSWPGYAPTPLRELTPIAKTCGVASVLYKDEASRFGLGSFKALGGAYAVGLFLKRHVSEALKRPVGTAELLAGQHRQITNRYTVVTATDGNHGRSVAAGAKAFGCQSVVVLHAAVSPGREAAIASLGARIVRVAGDFDAATRAAAELAWREDCALMADTNAHGGDAACLDIMAGYTVMSSELLDQLIAVGQPPPTHVFVQAGVGGLAAAVCAHLGRQLGRLAPIMVVVEAERADCLFQTASAGRPTRASGDLDTMMAGLACGEVSALAWDVLKEGAEFFMTVPDEAAIAAMRILADSRQSGARIVAGESAAAGLAGLLALAADETARRAARLDEGARVLLIGTEGATDPKLYEAFVGHAADGA
jgi:diaminopropionate ammonia-lyase